VVTNGSGGGWASDTGGSVTARGTGYSALENTRGYWTNKNAIGSGSGKCYNGTTDEGAIAADQATYLGSFYTTAAGATSFQPDIAGAAGGSNSCACLFNAYNRVPYSFRETDSTGNWSDTSRSWRVADGSSSNAVRWVDGLQQSPVLAIAQTIFQPSSGQAQIGINFDSTTAAPIALAYGGISTNVMQFLTPLNSKPLMGLHTAYWMELAVSANVTFWGSPYGNLTLQIAD
jgi:hypothetical protein